MTSRGGPLAAKKNASEACKNENVIQAAKVDLAHVDLLICGTCNAVFHFIAEFHEHKKSDHCLRPPLDPTTFESTSKIWAFMLWKNSDRTKEEFPDDELRDEVVMWRHWDELDSVKKRSWTTAGSIFWEITALKNAPHEVDPLEFDATLKKNAIPLVTPVPLAALQADPKVSASTSVSLKRLPDEATSSQESSPPSKKSKVERPSRKSKKAALASPSPEATDSAEDEEGEGEEYVVEAIVGKRYNSASGCHEYRIKWEGFPSSQNTWEPEENLTHCKDMIANYNSSKASAPPITSANGRPIRSSKARAMDRVKSWTSSSKPGDSNVDMMYEPDIDIKIEEKDPLDPDYDDMESVGDREDNFDFFTVSDNAHTSPPHKTSKRGRPRKQTLSIRDESMTVPKVSPKKSATSKATTDKPIPQASPKKFILKSIPEATSKSKQVIASKKHSEQIEEVPTDNATYNDNAVSEDPKNSTLLVANSLGMVRVNIKSLSNVKPGIYPTGVHEQLNRIKPLMAKSKLSPSAGLVVITSSGSDEKPGVRRKPQLPLVSNKKKTPVTKARQSVATTKPAEAAAKVVTPKVQPAASPSSNTMTVVLPTAPVTAPVLIMSPPSSGMGAVLITPENTTAKTNAAADISLTGGKTSKTPEPASKAELTEPKLSTPKDKDSPGKKVEKTKSPDISLSLDVQHDIDVDPAGLTPKKSSEPVKMITPTKVRTEKKKITVSDKKVSPDLETPKKKVSSPKKESDKKSKSLSPVKNTPEAKTDSSPQLDLMSLLNEIDKEIDSPVKSPLKAAAAPAEEDEEITLTGPTLVTLPPGADPTTVALPPNTQLMVSDTGEYYLVPQQDDGETFALTTDESGEMQLINVDSNSCSIVAKDGVVGAESSVSGEVVVVMGEGGQYMLVDGSGPSAK